MTRRITFTADYNHRWPSRAVSHFRAGQSYTVKAEVRDAAIANGKATEATEPATRDSDGKKARRRSPGRVAGRSADADRTRVWGDERGPDVGSGISDVVPVAADVSE